MKQKKEFTTTPILSAKKGVAIEISRSSHTTLLIKQAIIGRDNITLSGLCSLLIERVTAKPELLNELLKLKK